MWSVKASVPSLWREAPSRYRLEATECVECGARHYPPREICPRCGSKNLRRVRLPESGKVISFTHVRAPLRGFEYYTPLTLAIIELDDGTRILGQLTDVDPEDVVEGMRVSAVIRIVRVSGETGVVSYALKFRPEMPTGDR